MKKQIRIILISTCLILMSRLAHAFLIVDTGPGSGVTSSGVLENDQRAFKFSTSQSLIIGLAEFYMYASLPLSETSVNATISIFDDNSNEPGNVLFSRTLDVGTLVDWRGVMFNEYLTAGNYWLGGRFTTPPVNDFSRGLLWLEGAPNPVEYGAYKDGNNQWSVAGNYIYDIGMRIDANLPENNTSPVPEPATCLLFGTGVLGAVARRRKSLV